MDTLYASLVIPLTQSIADLAESHSEKGLMGASRRLEYFCRRLAIRFPAHKGDFSYDKIVRLRMRLQFASAVLRDKAKSKCLSENQKKILESFAENSIGRAKDIGEVMFFTPSLDI